MNLQSASTLSEEYHHWLTQCSGRGIDATTAEALLPKIERHQSRLSELLNREVGIRVAAIDYIELSRRHKTAGLSSADSSLFSDLGAQSIDHAIWDTIADSQPPKQIVTRRIIMPLTRADLARKHAVVPPRTIIFFGPPGTGKTHFVKAIAGYLQWWFIEISPSTLMADGEERLGANLKNLMEQVRDLDNTVLFIDEFEEIAGSRDNASRMEKSITNELLKQIPSFKERSRRNLLVCATNYISHLDAALLRPGRFDCIIPVGGLDDQSRRRIVEHYLADTNRNEIDVDGLISEIPLFTPAEIEYLFQKVRQEGFERECIQGEDFRVTTQMFLDVIPTIRNTLNSDIIETFRTDCDTFTRY